MATEHSFDIVAMVDLAEVQNALQNTLKQINNRFDFKGKTAKIDYVKQSNAVVVEGSDTYVADKIVSIFFSQLAKRNVDLKAFEDQGNEPASAGGLRKTLNIRDTIQTDECKKITAAVKAAKLKKVRATILGESVRIAAPSRDDLQNVQSIVRELNLPCPIRFTNYK